MKINKLTGAQIQALDEAEDEWFAHGLATGPADRAEAEAGVADAYRAAGLEPPTRFVWLGSPMAGAIGAWLLAGAKANVRDQVGPQVWDQVETRLRSQTGIQAGNQVRTQVWVRVRDQVQSHVRAQVEDEVWARIWDQVRGRRLRMVTLVRDQVRTEVKDQVRARVWRHVRDQIEPEVRAQIGDEAWAEVQDQVRNVALRNQGGAHILKSIPGQHDAEWLAFYDYFRAQCSITEVDRVAGIMRVARSAGRWWPFDHAVILTERPTVLHLDDQSRLHCETGPAIAYPDGFALWARHGSSH